jgi:hypothetical protein
MYNVSGLSLPAIKTDQCHITEKRKSLSVAENGKKKYQSS